MLARWSLIGVLFIAAACVPSPEPRPATRPADAWVLERDVENQTEAAWVGNGLVGVRLWPNHSLFIAGQVEGPEEKIREFKSPLAVELTVDGKPLSYSLAARRAESLDMRTGVVSTRWAWPGLTLRVETVAHPRLPIVATRWQLVSQRPRALGEVATTRPDDSMIVTWGSTTGGDRELSGERIVSVAVGGQLPSRSIRTYEQVQRSAEVAWRERWKTDIEIDGPVEDQRAIRSFLFYLQAIHLPPGRGWLSPMGLTNNLYDGHVFWDADVWLCPALAFVAPDVVRAHARYRLDRLGAARENFLAWAASQRRAPGPGVMFPWQSSASGRDVHPGPSRAQHHVTGSVALGLQTAAALGLADRAQVRRAGEGAADFFLARSEERADGQRSIRRVMSPDEHQIVDDDLYGNMVAQWCVDRWRPGAARFYFPRNAEGEYLTYEGDQGVAYKQAAAVLAAFPLQFAKAEAQSRSMLTRFASRTIPQGPAMSEGVHALLWARLDEPEKAYAAWQSSWRPYWRGLGLFAEKRHRLQDRTYFTTGAAAALNAVLYGFLGIRVDTKRSPGAVWFKRLEEGYWMSIRPRLPVSWKSATFRNFWVLGSRYTLTVDQQSVNVIQGVP